MSKIYFISHLLVLSATVSVCSSACLSEHVPTAANPLVQVCCCGPGRQEISIDCCVAGARQQQRAVPRCLLT